MFTENQAKAINFAMLRLAQISPIELQASDVQCNAKFIAVTVVINGIPTMVKFNLVPVDVIELPLKF